MAAGPSCRSLSTGSWLLERSKTGGSTGLSAVGFDMRSARDGAPIRSSPPSHRPVAAARERPTTAMIGRNRTLKLEMTRSMTFASSGLSSGSRLIAIAARCVRIGGTVALVRELTSIATESFM